jgi:HSP20 family protein
MPLVSIDPTRTLLRLQEALDQLHRNPRRGLPAFGPAGLTVFPPINVFSDGDGLVVRAEVPGFGPDSLEITVERYRLTIRGERSGEGEGAGASYHRRERQAGSFSRIIELPDDLDTDHATAECRDGILTIRMPRRPDQKRRRVSIDAQ